MLLPAHIRTLREDSLTERARTSHLDHWILLAPAIMRAVGIRGGKGSADDLFIEENVPEPVVSGDRILVRVYFFGLNRMDIMQREDRYPYPLLPESGKILGVEFSGIVEAKGPDCAAPVSPELPHTSAEPGYW